MTEKLSQFTAATPTLTDYVASATAGSPNKKYLVSDLQTLTVGTTPIAGGSGNVLFDNAGILGETTIPLSANGNKTYYVATTGSDSNPGTIGSPFATLTHALIVASKFDYQTLYTPTINIADGTYTATAGQPGAAIPPFLNLAPNRIGVSIVGNSGTPSNVVIQCGTGGRYGIVQIAGADTNTVTIDGVSLLGITTTSGGESAVIGGDLVSLAGRVQYNSIICNGAFPVIASGPSSIIADNPVGGTLSVTITSTTVGYAFQALTGGTYYTQFAVITLPAVAMTAVYAFLQSSLFANMTFQYGSIVNQASAAGSSPLFASAFSIVYLNNANVVTDIPGTGTPAADNTVLIGFPAGDSSLSLIDEDDFQFISGVIFGGNWGVVKNNLYGLSGGKGIGVFTCDYDYGNVKCLTPEVLHVVTQFDKTSDAALANIPDLVVHINGSGCTYQFNATLFTTSDAAGGVQASVGGTCVPNFIIYEGQTTAGAAIVAQTRATAKGTAVGAVTAVTAARIDIMGLVKVTTKGTLTIQFAQNISDVTASSVLVGSYFAVQQTS